MIVKTKKMFGSRKHPPFGLWIKNQNIHVPFTLFLGGQNNLWSYFSNRQWVPPIMGPEVTLQSFLTGIASLSKALDEMRKKKTFSKNMRITIDSRCSVTFMYVCVCVFRCSLGEFLSIFYIFFLFCMDFSNVFFFDKNIEDLFENWVVHDFAKPMPGVGEWHQMLGPLFGARECHLNLNGYWEKGSDSKGGILRWCINVSWEGLCAYNKDAS